MVLRVVLKTPQRRFSGLFLLQGWPSQMFMHLWSVFSLNPILWRSFPTRWDGDKVLWPKPRHLEDRLGSWPSKSIPFAYLTYYRFTIFGCEGSCLSLINSFHLSQSVFWLLFFVDSFCFFAPLSIAHFHRPFLMAVFECLLMLWISILVAISISISIRP